MLTKYKLLFQIGGALALVAALVGLGYWVGSSWTGAEWEAKYEKREGQYKEAGRLAEQQARSEESRRSAAVEGIRREARERIDQVEADASDANSTAVGLRKRVAELSRRPARCPATDAGSQAEPDDDKLRLGVVLEQMEAEGRRMARAADEAIAAGLACEEQYQSVTDAASASSAN